MSASLAGGIKSIAEKVAAAIPEAVGGFLFGTAVDLIKGGSDIQHLQDSLKKVLDELENIRSSIDRLSQEILDFRVQVKTDFVQTYVNNIDSEYGRIMDILNGFSSILKNPSGQDADIEKIEEAQKRLKHLLEGVADHVGPWLDQIHSFLCTQKEDNRLITLATRKARETSQDFLSYYCRVRIVLMEYYMAEARAIALLKMAVKALGVSFAEGPETIRRAFAYLEEQENTFRTTVGLPVVDLAERLLKTDDDVPITLLGCDNRCIYTGKYGPLGYPEYYQKEGLLHEVLGNPNGKDRWYIQRIERLDGKIPNGGYTFRLREDQTGHYMNATTVGIQAISNMNHGGWRVKHSIFPGKFSLRYTDYEQPKHTYRDLYLYINPGSHSPGYDKNLDLHKELLDSNPGMFFGISPR